MSFSVPLLPLWLFFYSREKDNKRQTHRGTEGENRQDDKTNRMTTWGLETALLHPVNPIILSTSVF